jgi:tRNA pseudouridine13 synthase
VKQIHSSEATARSVSGECPRAHGAPVCVGRIRVRPEDFQVEEILGFEPDGSGAHTLVSVRKTGANTDWAARRLARSAGVAVRDVGFAGLKDRHAVTTQWFSIPGAPDLDLDGLRTDGLEVVRKVAHGRKLRRGCHTGNRFRIRVRDCYGPEREIEGRLKAIVARGVPNYFGPQRFGRDGGNLRLASALASGRKLNRRERGFALSAARSAIFNAALAERIEGGDWDRLTAGDVAILDGSASWFPVDDVDSVLRSRLDSFDIHPSGPLWGQGRPPTTGPVREREEAVAGRHPDMADCLVSAGLKQERRSLRLPVRDFRWRLGQGEMELEFRLPRGAFATTVLSEILEVVGDSVSQAAGRSST